VAFFTTQWCPTPSAECWGWFNLQGWAGRTNLLVHDWPEQIRKFICALRTAASLKCWLWQLSFVGALICNGIANRTFENICTSS